MKAYLFRHNPDSVHIPDAYHVCINSKLHITYMKWSRDGFRCGRKGDIGIDEFTACLHPCDGSCISSLFCDNNFAKHHPLTPAVQEFFRAVLEHESKEDVPKQYIPFIMRVLSGEDMEEVEKAMRTVVTVFGG